MELSKRKAEQALIERARLEFGSRVINVVHARNMLRKRILHFPADPLAEFMETLDLEGVSKFIYGVLDKVAKAGEGVIVPLSEQSVYFTWRVRNEPIEQTYARAVGQVGDPAKMKTERNKAELVDKKLYHEYQDRIIEDVEQDQGIAQVREVVAIAQSKWNLALAAYDRACRKEGNTNLGRRRRALLAVGVAERRWACRRGPCDSTGSGSTYYHG